MNLKPISYFFGVYTTWFFIQNLFEIASNGSHLRKSHFNLGGKFEFRSQLFSYNPNCHPKSLSTYSTNISSLFLVLPSPFMPLSSFISSMGRMPNICCNFTMTGIYKFCPKIIMQSSKKMRPFSKLKILTVAMNELLCLKNVGAQIPMFFYLK